MPAAITNYAAQSCVRTRTLHGTPPPSHFIHNLHHPLQLFHHYCPLTLGPPTFPSPHRRTGPPNSRKESNDPSPAPVIPRPVSPTPRALRFPADVWGPRK